jgi:hypothetical protein
MSDISEEPPYEEPANLRFLRRLVTVLTAVMILGLLVLIALIVIRLQTPAVTFPDTITLPEGADAQAYTKGRGWNAIVTDQNTILIYDAETGELRQTVTIE